jgi:hypothetical protein
VGPHGARINDALPETSIALYHNFLPHTVSRDAVVHLTP